MAKQNVTFIERHLEKLVLGVAVGVLLAVVFLYFVQTPHAVDVSGQKQGPENFYASFRSEADLALQRIRSAGNKEAEAGEGQIKLPDMMAQLRPYEWAKLPREFSVPFVPPAPPIPEVTGTLSPDKVKLARILPLAQPVLTTGRAFVGLPQTEEIEPGSSSASPTALTPIPEDHHWVAVFSSIPRKEQREVFEKARYLSNLLTVIVADLQAERQTMLPNGEWSEPELVEGYTQRKVIIRETVPLYEQDDGSLAIVDSDKSYIEALDHELRNEQMQEQIQRPSFQDLLDKYAYHWEAPRQLPNLQVSLEDYGIMYPVDEKQKKLAPRAGDRLDAQPTRRAGRTARGAEGRAGNAPRNSTGLRGTQKEPEAPGIGKTGGRAEVVRLLRDAKKAIADEEFLTAEELLNQIAGQPDANTGQKQEAQTLLTSIRQQVAQARRNEEIKQLQQQQGGPDEILGEDLDPCWITDTLVAPGKTYRYRVRMRVLNQYAGYANRLEDPNDAGKVIIAGEWSPWSDPIETRPVQHLFVTKMGENKAVVLELREWDKGEWKAPLLNQRGVGQPLAFGNGEQATVYPAVLASVQEQRNYLERTVNRDGMVSYREKPTITALLIKPNGEIEERIAEQDKGAKNELLRRMKKEKEDEESFGQKDSPVLRQTLEEPPPRGTTGRQTPARAPSGGGGRFR